MKKHSPYRILLCLLLVIPAVMQAQPFRFETAIGDTATINPFSLPPDSTYEKNIVVIKVDDYAVEWSELCYDYPNLVVDTKGGGRTLTTPLLDTALRRVVLSEQISISSLFTNLDLVDTLVSYGCNYALRMTAANPCADTISITRRGDTVACDDYKWLVLVFDNDTSVPDVIASLVLTFPDDIAFVMPSFYYREARIPNDTYYQGQRGLMLPNNGGMNIERAWDFTSGRADVKTAIIDDGVDYRRCDYGQNGMNNLGQKIRGGWSWSDNNGKDMYIDSQHGTQVTSIVGALTNRNTCGDNLSGVAGIAGGWGPLGGGNDEGIGSQIFSFRVEDDNNMYAGVIVARWAWASLREAAAYNPQTGYGYGVHVSNLSFSGLDDDWNESGAIHMVSSLLNAVTITAAAGNSYGMLQEYPASTWPRVVTSVGNANAYKNTDVSSTYGYPLDIIAPGTCFNSQNPQAQIAGRQNPANPDNFSYTIRYNNDAWGCAAGTSLSAPHIAGLQTLMRSYLKNHSISHWETEDYEGVMKALAEDRTFPTSGAGYTPGYDDKSGYGFARADEIFDRLSGGWEVEHIIIDKDNSTRTVGDWEDAGLVQYVDTEAGGNLGKQTGRYPVVSQRRKITFEISAPLEEFSEEHELYVWGRGVNSRNSGWERAQLQFQVGYCHPDAGDVETSAEQPYGIRVTDRNTLKIHTYEYRVTHDILGRIFSPYLYSHNLDDIEAHISLFGMKALTDVDEEQVVRTGSLTAYPNPAVDNIRIRRSHAISESAIVRLLDATGRELVRRMFQPGQEEMVLDAADMNSGMYFVHCMSNGLSVKTDLTTVIVAR